MNKTIVFVHGAWMTPLCWEKFVGFFEGRGYGCIAPAWPHNEGTVEELRKKPPEGLAGLGIQEIVVRYAREIAKLNEPPILIGHSFGGLFVQMLLDRGLGSAGIAIDTAPPKGVFVFDPTSLLSVGRILLVPFGWRKGVRWTFA